MNIAGTLANHIADHAIDHIAGSKAADNTESPEEPSYLSSPQPRFDGSYKRKRNIASMVDSRLFQPPGPTRCDVMSDPVGEIFPRGLLLMWCIRSPLVSSCPGGEEESEELVGDSFAVHVARPEEDAKSTPPPMYKVLLHNDDFTPMEFVVAVLENYFGMDQSRAFRTMLDVHRRGIGVCGVFTKEIAETKAMLVTEKAKQHHYPLKCTHEEDKEDFSS